MKKNEIIKFNDVEYTLELNRDSFLQIDKICNVQKAFEIINRGLYDYVDEIDDNYNPLENTPTDEEIEKEIEIKEKQLHNLIERAFYIWLYPNHKLPISEVKKLLEPYFADEEKANWIGKKVGEYLKECVAIRENYNEQRKNLKAQANK